MLTQCASNEIPTLEAPTTVMNVAAWAALFQIKDPVADAVPHCTLPLTRHWRGVHRQRCPHRAKSYGATEKKPLRRFNVSVCIIP
jgi:hypothetical protein